MNAPQVGFKLGFFGPMKTVDSANATFDEYPDGRVRAQIEHEDMKGMTPEMLIWWFSNIDTFMDHIYQPVDGGCSYITEMWIGVTVPVIGKLINKLIRTIMFPDKVLKDWLLHNVEESGETEKFVPQLYEYSTSKQQ